MKNITSDLPIVGKTYWYCGRAGMTKNLSRFRYIQKPIKVIVVNIIDETVHISYMDGGSVCVDGWSIRFDNTPDSEYYWKMWLFDTEEEAKFGFNDKLDKIKSKIELMFDKISEKIDSRKFSV